MNTEEELIKLVAEGNRAAFTKLYALFKNQVYNTAISYVQNIQDAEEITQDVFVNIHKNAKQFKGNSKVATWIYRITINSALNVIKKKKRLKIFQSGIQEFDKPDFEHPGVVLENKENSKMLFNVIDSLSPNQKTAFILSYVEGLPRQEVANVMEMSLKAVESLLQRGKQNLRTILIEKFPERRK